MNKNALITGSTSGIGLAIAKTLALNGYNVVLNGVTNQQEISDVINTFQKETKITPQYHKADVTNSKEIVDMIHYLENNFGSISLIVNNAGIQYVSPIEEFPDEKWEDIIATNLSASFYVIKTILPYMKARGEGTIVNIASTHGLVASVNKSAYVSAKHGIIGLTKATALETANTGITCNAICPGWVKTPLVEKQISENAKNKGESIQEAELELLAGKHPTHQFVPAEDIGEAVLFLAKIKSMTGEALIIDQGWVAQ